MILPAIYQRFLIVSFFTILFCYLCNFFFEIFSESSIFYLNLLTCLITILLINDFFKKKLYQQFEFSFKNISDEFLNFNFTNFIFFFVLVVSTFKLANVFFNDLQATAFAIFAGFIAVIFILMCSKTLNIQFNKWVNYINDFFYLLFNILINIIETFDNFIFNRLHYLQKFMKNDFQNWNQKTLFYLRILIYFCVVIILFKIFQIYLFPFLKNLGYLYCGKIIFCLNNLFTKIKFFFISVLKFIYMTVFKKSEAECGGGGSKESSSKSSPKRTQKSTKKPSPGSNSEEGTYNSHNFTTKNTHTATKQSNPYIADKNKATAEGFGIGAASSYAYTGADPKKNFAGGLVGGYAANKHFANKYNEADYNKAKKMEKIEKKEENKYKEAKVSKR